MATTRSAKRRRTHRVLKHEDAASTVAAAVSSSSSFTEKKRSARDFMNKSSKSSSSSVPPSYWQDAWDAITRMRADRTAPVDTMGCAVLGDKNGPPKDFRFQTLVALMLSSQTKDQTTATAMKNLMRHWPNGLTVDNIRNASDATVDSLISKVGFHNKKTQYLKRTADMLHDEYDGDLPTTPEGKPSLDGLLALPGIGKKMAYLCMEAAWGECIGIGVDVHVHRIANRLGWVKNTKNPEATRTELEGWLPRSYWATINPLLVGHGQQTCSAQPACNQCEARKYCKHGRRGLKL